MNRLRAWPPTIIYYFGPMYSGKTNKAITILYAVLRAMKRGVPIKAAVVRPKLDTRNKRDRWYLKTHTGKVLKRFRARIIDHAHPWDILKDRVVKTANVVVIDEVQFFDPAIARVILVLLEQGKRVYILGLDLDHLGRPFPTHQAVTKALKLLPAESWQMKKMTAICDHCGGEATHSRRLIGGKQATARSGRFVVEGKKLGGKKATYEAVCSVRMRECLAEAGIKAPWLDESGS